MTRGVVLALLAVPIMGGATLEAQAVDPPPRVTKPPSTQGTTSSLQLGTSLFGGYNRNLVSTKAQAPTATIEPNAFTGWGSANLRYTLSSGARSLEVGGGATANTNNNAGRVAANTNNSVANSGPVFGANANVGFRTPLGRGATLALSQSASRTPYYSMGLFGGLPPGIYSPDSNPINGIVDGHLLALGSSVAVGYELTRRTSTSVSYAYRKNLHEGGQSSEMSYDDHSASLGVTQQISESTGVTGSYRIMKHGADQAGFQYDGFTHGFSLGFQRSQQLSRTRSLAIGVGGGADLVNTDGSNRYWQPTYYASLGTDIGRSWVVSANYSQTSAMLYSPLSAPDSYLTQTAILSVGGDLSRTLSLVVNVGATMGDVAGANSVTGSPGHYVGVNSGVQLSTRLWSGWSAVVSGNYYRSELSGAAKQFLVSSGDFQRTSVRGGLTWNVPLLNSGRSGRPPRER